MARDNYSFQKRKKELARKKKQEAKIQRRLDKKNAQIKEGETQTSAEAGQTPNELPQIL
ncbi:MAG: hypothetical protein NTV07_07260 [Candidatus Omnitrophica bacterium]|nr:hypothetical protein [Candidatus Omnitrophota bacterium]